MSLLVLIFVPFINGFSIDVDGKDHNKILEMPGKKIDEPLVACVKNIFLSTILNKYWPHNLPKYHLSVTDHCHFKSTYII